MNPANENVEKKDVINYTYSCGREIQSTKVAQFHSIMISDVTFEHLLAVCEIMSENNRLTVYSLPLSRGRIVPVV